jgi:hypothetical protein
MVYDIHPIRIIERSTQAESPDRYVVRTQVPSRTESVKYYTYERNGKKTYVKHKIIGAC